jgi:hypothetical protein
MINVKSLHLRSIGNSTIPSGLRIKRLADGDINIIDPDDFAVKWAVEYLRICNDDNNGLSMDLGKDISDSLFIMCYSDGFGYHISCAGRSDKDNYTARDMQKPREYVYAVVGGQGSDNWPLRFFVTKDIAIMAALHYLHTGERSPDVSWTEGLDDGP